MTLPIYGFGLSNYRSVGGETQYVTPLSKINFFAGQNNSGKSNLLRFIQDHYSSTITAMTKGQAYRYSGLDVHRGNVDLPQRIALPLDNVVERFGSSAAPESRGERLLKGVIETGLFFSEADKNHVPFFNSPANESYALVPSYLEELKAKLIPAKQNVKELWSFLHDGRTSNEDFFEKQVPSVIRQIALRGIPCPVVTVIPAIRRIGDGDTSSEAFDGTGIIEKLAHLQHPEYENLSDKLRFNAINELLRSIVGNSSASIEVPVSKKDIHVSIDGHVLPIGSLGTGIHELIILAVAATTLKDQVVCIEEPELHLHPILQRKLIEYLETETSNQYFFATHSAHILNSANASVFHVRQSEGVALVDCATTSFQRAELCFDLGYVASDILQANSVIWVEGPSDRIYLNHWLSLVDPELIEGIHYSIMFYGGRLLSHLSANDQEINEFISLRRLNRNMSLVIDSDKRAASSTVSATKLRVSEEFSQGNGFAWVTWGREIENYIAKPDLLAGIQEVYSDATSLSSVQRFHDALKFIGSVKRGNDWKPDKIKVAHAVCSKPSDLGMGDLREKLDQIVGFVRRANGLTE